MKKLIAALALLMSAPSFSAISTFSLEELDGQTVTTPNVYETDVIWFSVRPDIDLSETGFTQLEIFIDLTDKVMHKERDLLLFFGSDFYLPIDVNDVYNNGHAVDYRGVPVEDFAFYGNESTPYSALTFGIGFDYIQPIYRDSDIDFPDFQSATFGPNSYMRITNAEEGLYPNPIPETGTFALFLLGAVGLCVRRQMKQQA